MKLGLYDVLNTNSSKAHSACLRIKLNGVILAETWSDHSNPLKWTRTHPLSKERQEIVRQLRANDVCEADIFMLMKLPNK